MRPFPLRCFSGLSFVLLFLICLTPAASLAQTGSDGHVSMSKVTDVTGGLTTLLEDQDVVRLSTTTDKKVTTTAISSYLTDSSKVSGTKNQSLVVSTSSDAYNTKDSILSSEASARMYNSKTDLVVLLTPVDNTDSGATSPTWRLTLVDAATGQTWTKTLAAAFVPQGTVSVRVATGDFDGDHLSDVLVYFATQIGDRRQWEIKVVTADDKNTPGSLKEGPEFFGELPQSFAYEQATFTVGDFNGDGRDEFAVMETDRKTVDFYAVDSSSLGIKKVTSVDLPYTMVLNQLALAAGKYRSQPNADVLVFGQIEKGEAGYSVIPIRVTPSGDGSFTGKTVDMPNATEKKRFYRFPDYHGASGALAEAAPFVFWPSTENQQALLGIQTMDGSSFVLIGGFDTADDALSEFVWYSESRRRLDDAGITILLSLHAGNFDRKDVDGNHSPKSQVTTEELGGFIATVRHILIFDVNAPSTLPSPKAAHTDWLKLATDHTLSGTPEFVDGTGLLARSDIDVPTDVQGRSLRLGSPTIVRVDSQSQPSYVLGAPPMHVDHITPRVSGIEGCESSSEPCDANISMLPSVWAQDSATAFDTSLEFEQGAALNTDQSSTSSWSIASKASNTVEGNYQAEGLDIKGDVKTSVEGGYESTVKKKYGTYKAVTTSGEVITVYSDLVSYNQAGANVYYYPILGCETEPSNCTLSTKGKPAYAVFSVPDNSTQNLADAATLDWYQPVQEPGQIFSYPWSTAVHQKQFNSTVTPISTPGECLSLGQFENHSTIKWSKEQTSSNSTAWTGSWGTEVDSSLTVGGEIEGIGGASDTISLDVAYNGSLSGMNRSSTTLSASSGITVDIPQFTQALTSCCSYDFSQIMFGLKSPDPNAAPQKPCTGTATDCVPLSDPNGKTIGTAFNGPLRVNYTADVIQGGDCGKGSGSSFWQRVYGTPDIALNHPSRWNWSRQNEVATFNTPDNNPGDIPSGKTFYLMKGFFITKKGTPINPSTQLPESPTLQEAPVDTKLTLTTRVYNYSLAGTPAGTNVHVRVYGVLYCDNTLTSGCQGCPYAGNVCGDSFNIGEATIDSIPGFQANDNGYTNVAANDPNYRYASVDFDPSLYPLTKNGNVKLLFWVVTWLQKGNGATAELVAEMPMHGLTQLPPASPKMFSDEPMEAYSNNVGLYGAHSPFHLTPAGTLQSTPTQGTLAKLTLSAPATVTLDKSNALTATLQASGSTIDNVNIAYYDGDPAKTGKLIEMQSIRAMLAGTTYTHHANYAPIACGARTLYAQAWAKDSPMLQSMTNVTIISDKSVLISGLLRKLNTATFADATTKTALIALLNQALAATKAGQVSTADALLSSFRQQVTVSGVTTGAKALDLQADGVLDCSSSGFYLSALQSAATTTIGGSSTFAMAVTPSGNFNGTVQLACATARTLRCTVSTNTVQLSGTGQASFQVEVQTGVPTTAGVAGPLWRRPFALIMLGLLLLPTLSMRKTTRMRLLGLLLTIVISAAATGCGDPSSALHTTPGGYQVQVSAVSGASSQTITLNLNVK